MGSKVVIAVDSFKGSISSAGAGRAIAEGWLSVRPSDDVVVVPLADGGEGTLDAFEAAVAGTLRHTVSRVSGPDRRPVDADWLELPGRIGVVELAQSSGLPLMRRADALTATTLGLGQVIAAALDLDLQQLIVGLGGSASTDGGSGALSALGLQGSGSVLDAGGAALLALTSLDPSLLRPPPAGGVILLTDVTAPLFGPSGAAAVFGPQKGADAAAVDLLDDSLRHFAHLLGGSLDVPGAGAAGGTAYGFSAAWGAEIRSGAEYITGLADLGRLAREADVVLTGEGRFDATSLTGKLVGEVIRMTSPGTESTTAARIGVIAGAVSVRPHNERGEELWSAELSAIAGSAEAAIADPIPWLRRAGEQAATALG